MPARSGKGESRVRDVLLADLTQNRTRFGAANVDHRTGRGDLNQRGILRQMLPDPVTIMHTKARASDDVELVLCQSGDG